MVKNDITYIVAEKVHITKQRAEAIINAILIGIKDGIATDGEFYVRGFGCFRAKNKSERIGRNPKNGESAIIKARRVVTFKAYKPLKKQVNIGDKYFVRSQNL